MLDFVRECLIRQRLTPLVLKVALAETQRVTTFELIKEWLDHRPQWFAVSDLLLLDWCQLESSDNERLEYYCAHRASCVELRVEQHRLDEERLIASTCLAMLDISAFGFNDAFGTVPDVEPVSACAEKLGSLLMRAKQCHLKPSALIELKTETIAYLSSEECAHIW
ncbi:MAG TPA: hypothetical protein PKA27_15730 [Fimbriimonadaceae bacterium]|nr:hypothetical protein [Fimbriimonadaceae bacterium]